MKSFALHLLMAVIWMFLSRSPDIASFVVGWTISLGMMVLFRPVLPQDGYLRRLLGGFRFIHIFLREFLSANWQMVRVILTTGKESLEPNFVTLDVSDLSRSEILLLSYCITLTPGTSSIQITDNFKTLYIHALQAADPDQIRHQINTGLKRAILGMTR